MQVGIMPFLPPFSQEKCFNSRYPLNNFSRYGALDASIAAPVPVMTHLMNKSNKVWLQIHCPKFL